MPGTVTSMPNSGLPVTIAFVSTPRTRVPTMENVFASLSFTASSAGAGTVAAFSTSAPYASERPLAR